MANNFSNDTSCKALWRFESGAMTTDSKSTNTLTASGSAPAEDTTNKAEGGCSASFAGDVLRYYERTDADLAAGFPLKTGDSTQQITICAWVRPLTDSEKGIICKGNFSSGSIFIKQFTGDCIKLNWNGVGDQCKISLSAYSLWIHIAYLIDGVNGTCSARAWDSIAGVITPTPVSGLSNASWDLSLAWRMGALSNSATNYFDGNLDEVVVFNRLLSNDEIDAIRGGTYNETYPAGGYRLIPTGGVHCNLTVI